jgi:hypothetical protein
MTSFSGHLIISLRASHDVTRDRGTLHGTPYPEGSPFVGESTSRHLGLVLVETSPKCHQRSGIGDKSHEWIVPE